MTDPTISPSPSPAPDPAPVPSPPREKNVLGLVALIVAIVGFVFACIPGALLVGWILLPVAFILSIVGLVLKNKKKQLAIAALILSVVGTIVGLVVFAAVVVGSVSDAIDGDDSVVTQPVDSDADAEAEADAEVGTRENPAALGSTITGDEYTVVVNSVTLDATDEVLAANMFNEAPEAGYSYAVVNITVTYTGSDSGYANFVVIDYVASTGEVATTSDNFAVAPEPALGVDELYNGGTATGNLVIAIPTGDPGTIRVTPGLFADEVFIAIQ